MRDSLHIDIRLRVSQRRTELKLTREALAGKTEPTMSSKYLWEIETGRKHLSAEMLRRIAIALDVSSDWILGMPNDKVR